MLQMKLTMIWRSSKFEENENSLTSTHVWAADVFLWIPIEERNAFLAMLALSVVLAVVADTAAHTTRPFVHILLEMATVGVIVTVTFCGRMNEN